MNRELLAKAYLKDIDFAAKEFDFVFKRKPSLRHQEKHQHGIAIMVSVKPHVYMLNLSEKVYIKYFNLQYIVTVGKFKTLNSITKVKKVRVHTVHDT